MQSSSDIYELTLFSKTGQKNKRFVAQFNADTFRVIHDSGNLYGTLFESAMYGEFSLSFFQGNDLTTPREVKISNESYIDNANRFLDFAKENFNLIGTIETCQLKRRLAVSVKGAEYSFTSGSKPSQTAKVTNFTTKLYKIVENGKDDYGYLRGFAASLGVEIVQSSPLGDNIQVLREVIADLDNLTLNPKHTNHIYLEIVKLLAEIRTFSHHKSVTIHIEDDTFTINNKQHLYETSKQITQRIIINGSIKSFDHENRSFCVRAEGGVYHCHIEHTGRSRADAAEMFKQALNYHANKENVHVIGYLVSKKTINVALIESALLY